MWSRRNRKLIMTVIFFQSICTIIVSRTEEYLVRKQSELCNRTYLESTLEGIPTVGRHQRAGFH